MEYAVIGVIVAGASIAMLGSLGGTFQGTLAGLRQDMATRRDAAIQQEVAALSVGRTERLDSMSKTFSTAEANLLQQSLADKVQTTGANGSTRLLAKQLSLLAAQLLNEGKITQEQYDLMMKLSNQGYRIARIEFMVEEAVRYAGGDAAVFAASQFNLDGQPQSAQMLAALVGYSKSRPTTDAGFLESSAEPEMENFLTLYRQLRDSGVLADPVVRTTVESAVIQIAQVGEGVEHAIFSSLEGNRSLPKDPPAFNDRLASAVTNMDSERICKAGNFKSDGIQCSP